MAERGGGPVDGLAVTVVLAGATLDKLADKLAVRLSQLAEADNSQPEWLVSAEAVEYLRLPSLDALHRLTGREAIPFRKVGNRCLFRRAELRDWLDGAYCGPPRT